VALSPLLSADPGPFKPGPFFVEPRLELVLGRQPELVARHEYIAVACGREAHNLGVTFRAEQNPNGWVLLWIGNILGHVIDVEAQLPRMLRLKRSHLEIDGDEAAQPTLEKKQIDVMMAIPRRDPKLPGDEAKIASELEQKLLKMIDERALQIAFGHYPASFDPQELENVGVPKLCGRRFGQSALTCKLQNLVALVAEPNPFIQQTVPLALQLAHGPALLKAVEFVKSAPSEIINP